MGFSYLPKGVGLSEKEHYIDVAVALPVYHTYTYRVPETLIPDIEIGLRVLVPFGQRKVTGYVLGSAGKKEPFKIKKILDILDDRPLFPESMIIFFKWIADYYMHPIGEVIKAALPGGLNLVEWTEISITEPGRIYLQSDNITPLEKEILSLLADSPILRKKLQTKLTPKVPAGLIRKMADSGVIQKKLILKGGNSGSRTEPYLSYIHSDIPQDRHAQKRKAILEFVRSHECGVSRKALKNHMPGADSYIPYLLKYGFISQSMQKIYRDPLGDPIPPDRPPDLSEEQQAAVSTVIHSLGSGFRAYLLSGVTGSGKTEVYMRIAEAALEKGFSTLILVPEIALISQTERRFRARFGECIAVLHSGLSAGERYDQWERILEQKVNIVIGARSAIFAPINRVGVIIVDEEHDTSYKQESRFRYNARDLAVVRAKQQDAIALLGSATPSVQSYYNADMKKFKRLHLTKRVMDRPMPHVKIVDLCSYRNERGIHKFITPELIQEIRQNLSRGEQVLLFLNRRGYANYAICSVCGEPMLCKNCDISLTLHKRINAYKCHFCGFSKASVSHCDKCGSSAIKPLGMGTEKIVSTMADLFPKARIARMDRDTTKQKGSLLKILKDLKKNNIDILVGTQMVAKGHDFPNITLVGIICADLSLNFPDFRASEQTFQILAQVAGRAGRGAVPGRVILQTYSPEHFTITTAQHQDYITFYNQEIVFRRALSYPPFARLIQLKISGKDQKTTKAHAVYTGECCKQLLKENPGFEKHLTLLGPVEAPLSKISGYYRWQILLKGSKINLLHALAHKLLFKDPKIMNHRSVTVAIDVDPVFML